MRNGWVLWLLPTGGEGGLHGYSLLGERVGCRVNSHWVVSFWLLPLRKLVSGLLPAGWRGWVTWLLTAGEVGFIVASCWGSWYQCYSLLWEWVGCMVTPCWVRGLAK